MYRKSADLCYEPCPVIDKDLKTQELVCAQGQASHTVTQGVEDSAQAGSLQGCSHSYYGISEEGVNTERSFLEEMTR